jgi:cell division transport system permease protein
MNTPAAMGRPVRHSRVAMWRRQHAWCVRDSLRQLARRPLGSALTVAVMGLALALPLAFYLLLANLQHLATALGDSQSVSVFLKSNVTAEGADQLAAMQGFGDAIKSLPDNPLPFVLLVEPRAGADRAQVESMVAAVRASPGVDLVQDSGQWRARLDALIALGRRVTLLLAALLGVAAVLVIGNTVRLDLRSRGDEIAVQRLIGASAAFVRRP